MWKAEVAQRPFSPWANAKRPRRQAVVKHFTSLNFMCRKLGFCKGHDISLQDLSHSSSAQQPSKTGKNGTVRTTQRTHGVSTYKLHCTAKTAKFFLARKLTAKQVQKHAEHAESNTDHVAATADHASAKQRASYQVTEHAPTHKGTKQRVLQEPNFYTPSSPQCVLGSWISFTSKTAPRCTQEEPAKLQWIKSTLLHLSMRVFMASLADRVFP